MTNDARTEKNLNRIQKKLQILTPIIQDANIKSSTVSIRQLISIPFLPCVP